MARFEFKDEGTKALGETFGLDLVEVGESWPSKSGKFEAGDVVRVMPAKGKASAKRFKSWLGKTGFVIGWQRSGGLYGGQSEYRIFDPNTKRSRWIWADQLELIR